MIQSYWQLHACRLPQEKLCCGRLHRSLLRLYRPQSAVSCSTLWERAAWSSPNTSQVSLATLDPKEKWQFSSLCVKVLFVLAVRHWTSHALLQIVFFAQPFLKTLDNEVEAMAMGYFFSKLTNSLWNHTLRPMPQSSILCLCTLPENNTPLENM